MALSTITSKGQITIPKPIRDSMHLFPGDKVEFVVTDSNEIILKPVTKKAVDVFGLLRAYGKGKSVSIKEMDEGIEQHIRDKFQ